MALPPSTPQPSIDLRYYLQVFWRRRWLILAVLAIAVTSITTYVLKLPKVYQAVTSVIIDVTAPRFLDNQVQDVMDNGGAGNYWRNREYYETEHSVIMSRAVSARVVEKLGLQNDPRFLGVEKIQDEKARAEAMRGIDATALLQSKIKVVPVKDSRLVQIAVEDSDPNRAAALANEVAESYIAENLALKLRITDNASKWLEDRLTDLEEKSKKSELLVYDFKKTQDMLTASVEDRVSMITQRLTTYNGALTEARTRIAALKARMEAITRLKKASPDGDLGWLEALPGANSDLIKSLKERYVAQGAECAELSDRYLPGHPKLAACQDKLRALEQDLRRELNAIIRTAENQLVEATAQEKHLASLLEASKAEAFELNKKQITFEQLKRDADNNQRLYELVLKRLKDIELSGLLRTSNVRLLDAALPNPVPLRPNVRSWVMLSVLLGLLLGLGASVVLELLDNTIASQSDVEERMGVAFLGFVPKLDGKKGVGAQGLDLYIHSHPKSPAAESCRAIRTNLLFMSPDKPFRTLLVTSGAPGEGKSATTINLGIAMAQSGNRVLLLDTDLRRPRLHRAFGVPNDLGVSSLVVGKGTVAEAVKSTDVPGLFVLPGGPMPPNPSELLHTDAFAQLLAGLTEKYDRVILDSPPIGAVADALVLSAQVDGVVLVVKAGSTHRDAAVRSVRTLADVNAKLFGAVLNHLDLSNPRYGSAYASYYQYGSYGES